MKKNKGKIRRPRSRPPTHQEARSKAWQDLIEQTIDDNWLRIFDRCQMIRQLLASIADKALARRIRTRIVRNLRLTTLAIEECKGKL